MSDLKLPGVGAQHRKLQPGSVLLQQIDSLLHLVLFFKTLDLNVQSLLPSGMGNHVTQRVPGSTYLCLRRHPLQGLRRFLQLLARYLLELA